MNVSANRKIPDGPDKEVQVQTIFSEIAPRYDLLNHLLSLNIDRIWRKKAIRALEWESKRTLFGFLRWDF